MAKTDFDELMSIGIDIGKDTFHVLVSIRTGSLFCEGRSNAWR